MDKITQAECRLADICIVCEGDKSYFEYDKDSQLFTWRHDAYKASVIKDFCFKCWLQGNYPNSLC